MRSRFEIPLDNQRALFGVFLAAHAIPDAVDLMHTGVGCKPKAQRQISSHDRMREAQNKMVWSDVDESLLITGSADRLYDMTVETYGRREAVGVVFITTSTAMEMTGFDGEAAAARIRERIPCPVIYLPTPGHEGDLHHGYQRAVLAVMELCDWSVAPADPSSVDIVGYLFDRYEHDHAMSLHEVRRLLAGIGLGVTTTYLSGTPVAGLMQGPRAAACVVLPWAAGIAEGLPGLTGRPCVHVDLPLGLRATRRFLEVVGASRNVPPLRVASLVETETARIAPLVRIARERLAGSRAAVLADTPTAAGLVGLLDDLGVSAVLVGLLDRTLGGGQALVAALSRAGVTLPAGCRVIENPCARDIDEALAASPPTDAPHLLLAPDLWLPEEVTGRLSRVEIGIPSNRKHAIYAQPSLGYRGAVCLAQRLMDARAGVF